MATAKEPERVRLSLDVSKRVKNELTRLANRTEAGSLTEVIRRALSLYDLVIEHQEEGGKIIFRHRDKTEEALHVL
jgi:hypothetical protein